MKKYILTALGVLVLVASGYVLQAGEIDAPIAQISLGGFPVTVLGYQSIPITHIERTSGGVGIPVEDAPSGWIKYAYKTSLVKPKTTQEKAVLETKVKDVLKAKVDKLSAPKSTKDSMKMSIDSIIITEEDKGSKHARIFKTSSSTEGVAEVVAGSPQYYEDDKGVKWQVEYATATEAVFFSSLSPIDRVRFAISNFASPKNFYPDNERALAVAGLKNTVQDMFSLRIKTALAVDCTSPCTFYPDADAESTSVDGVVWRQPAGGAGETWATIRAGAGTGSADTGGSSGCNFGTGLLVEYDTISSPPGYRYIFRTIMLFDTNTLPNTASISSATLSLYGICKLHNNGNYDYNIYTSTPASNTGLANADYGQTGTTAQSDTAIAGTSLSTTGYNDWALNSTGIGSISLTGVSKFSLKSTQDSSNTDPLQTTRTQQYVLFGSAEDAGTTQDPKLVVTFTTGGGATPNPINDEPIWFH